MMLISSLRILKFKTLLLQLLTRSDTVTFKSTALVNSFLLCLLDQLVLVNQFTFKMCFYTHFLVKSIWLLKSVSQPKLIATRFRTLLTWNLIRSGLVFTDLVLEWNVLSSLMILTCPRKKSLVHSHPLKFSDNLWLKAVGMIIRTKSILSVSCKIHLSSVPWDLPAAVNHSLLQDSSVISMSSHLQHLMKTQWKQYLALCLNGTSALVISLLMLLASKVK